MSAGPISGPGPLPVPAPGSDAARLRQASQQLEGVFVEQLFKAMRETVPEGGVLDGGMGEEIFSSLMDGHIASTATDGWDRGLGAALYRQLRGAVQDGESPAAGEGRS